MKVHKHNVAMRWITRRRTNEVAGLYESFPGTFSAYQEALSGGFQGTMEEFIQLQSIPQSDRPFTGAVGGRVQYKPGGLVEPGVVNYGKKSYYQRMQEKNPGYFYKIKTKTFKIGDKTYKIGEAIKPNQITSLKEGLKKITQWKKNPTPGNWTELFRTPSKSGQTHQSEFSLNLRKYLSDKKIPPKTKKLFDLINIKSTIGTKTANSIKTFQADNAFWKASQTIKNIKIGKKVKEGSMAHINAIRDAFVWYPDSGVNDLAKFIYGDDFTNASSKQKFKIVNEISNDVPKFLEALNGARMVKNFNMPNDDIALDIIDNIQNNKRGFKFQEGTLRNYKFNIRDADIMLPEGTTLKDRNRLMKLKKGMGLAIDETGGLSATYQRAPGYTSGSQLIDNLLNKKKRTLIDKDFSNVLRAMVDGNPNAMYQWKGEEVTRDELVKNYNEHAEKFKKKYKIDAPTIQIGVNPKKAVSNYDLYSKAEQTNMQNIFKTKNFSIGFGKETVPLKHLLQTVKNVKGPKKIQAVTKMIAVLGSGKLADEYLKKQGINLTQNEKKQVQEASMFPTELIQENPVTSAFGALSTLMASKKLPGDPLKYLRKVPRKALSSLLTPTGAAAIWGATGGFDPKSGIDRAGLAVEVGLAPELVKWSSKLTKPIKNQAVRAGVTQALNLGLTPAMAMRVARVASPIGWATLGAEGLYQIRKAAQEVAKNPEMLEQARQSNLKMARAAEASGVQDVYGTEAMFNTGGRVPFGKGKVVKGIDEGRRAFMKWLAGITGAGVAAGTGLLKWGKVAGKGKTAIKAGDTIVQGTQGMPDWFIPLINRVVKEGDDVTKKLGTKEREIVHTKKIAEGEEVTVYQDLDTGNVRVDYDSPHNMGEGAVGPVSLEYRAPQVIDEGKYAGQKTKSEFEAYEPEPVGHTVGPDDYAIEWDGTNVVGRAEDLVSDTSKLKQFATKKKPTMGEIVESSKKKKEAEYYSTNEGSSDYVVNKQGEGEWDDYLPDIADMDY